MGKLLTIFIFACLVGVAIIPAGFQASVGGKEMIKEDKDSTGDWPMIHHDVRHTSYTSAKGVITEPELKRVINVSNDEISWCVVKDRKFVFATMDGVLYLFDSKFGKMWETLIWESPSSPVIADDKVVIATKDGSVYVLDIRTGGEDWSVPLCDSIGDHFSPIVSDVDGDRVKEVVITTEDGSIYVFDGRTGGEDWSTPSFYRTVSSPAVAYGNIYIGSVNHYVCCVDGDTGDIKWDYETGGKITSSPTIGEGKIYVGSWDHKIYCLDAYTGELKWDYTTGGIIYSSPAIFDGRIYVTSGDGNIYCIDASEGKLIWKKTVGNGSSLKFSPAIADIDNDGEKEVIVGSTDGYVYAFGANDGYVEWRFYLGKSSICSPPVIADLIDGSGVEILFVDTHGGKIYVIGSKVKKPEIPVKPSGPKRVKSGESATYFTFSENEMYYEKVKYVFDWGDGTTTESEPVDPSVRVYVSHTWNLDGRKETFIVRCKAVAVEPDTGLESDWSEPLEVTVRKSKCTKLVPLYFYFIEKFFNFLAHWKDWLTVGV